MLKKMILLSVFVLLLFLAGCQTTTSNNSQTPLNGETLFQDGLLLSSNGSLFGYVNSKFEVVIDFEYDYALPFMNGRAIVIKGDKFYLINPQGQKINAVGYEELTYYPAHDFYVAKKGQFYGVVDKNNVTKIDFVFDGHLNFSDGLAPFWVEIGYGYVSWDGISNISVQFQVGLPFENGFAPVRNNGLWGLIDTSGNVVVPYIYNQYTYADKNERIILHEMNPSTQAMEYRVVDFNQNQIFPFYNVITYANGLYVVTVFDGAIPKSKVYNKDYQLVIDNEFSACHTIHQEIICRTHSVDGKMNVVVLKGDGSVIYQIHDVSSQFSSQDIQVMHNLKGISYLVFPSRYENKTLLYESAQTMIEVRDSVIQLIDDRLVVRSVFNLSSVININNETILQATSERTHYQLFADFYIVERTYTPEISNDTYQIKIYDWDGNLLHQFASKINW